ncbi:uncharacterized protein LOC124188134 isoform X1 [Neodiprion fabricii]|uniref:uncharacterized protein LOC124188134 isoform X1 n=2 Tax=Neodiprion fabricii TaxID=2872261 RepID=UPI001ED9754A|nr:uncharacterized protein LOC124188134 isoform X1 [Neodiprion fabricii]
MVYLESDEGGWHHHYWVISLGAMLSFVGFLVSCVCGCRRDENKSELGGLAGMVTITHSDNEGFNRLPTTDIAHPISQDTTDAGKRTSSANRSLPDIPKDGTTVEAGRVETVPQDVIYEANEVMCDPSVLYATVEEKNSRRSDVRRGARELEETSLQSAQIEQDSMSPYTRLKNPGSKNDEHPYAQVQSVQKTEATQLNRNNVGHLVDTSLPSSSSSSSSCNHTSANPIAPPRARKSSSHNSLISSDPLPDIQAATAITGGVHANQDLPYMTPPILMPLPEPPQLNHHEERQQHFSGDSHDSKGYTSISVREPLANILAQTKAAQQERQQQRGLTDPHYATVSDDSDEMYAAIDEQEKVYTSGSETYAQIQPMVLDSVRVQQNEQIHSMQPLHVDDLYASAPQPPSVDSLRHVAHAHSRQASSSSATSSVANLGSPKPEKRQANSPLPPPPETMSDVYASVEKRGSKEDRLRASIASGKSLEDMYAKVMKKKRDIDDEQLDIPTMSSNNHHGENPVLNRKHSLIEVSRTSWSSHDSIEFQRKDLELSNFAVGNSSANFPTESEGNLLNLALKQNEADASKSGSDPGYEAVNVNRKSSIVRTVSDIDPNYEVLRPQFSRVSKNLNSVTQNNGIDVALMYSSPYKHRQISNASSEDPGYEKVRMRRRIDLDQDTDSEPNYESMPHDPGEPNYASVCRPGDSDTDPNYESVSQSDPNYESVKYLTVSQNEDPPYEQVNNYKSNINLDDYEMVRNKNEGDPNYEKIKMSHSTNLAHDGETDDEQYIHV